MNSTLAGAVWGSALVPGCADMVASLGTFRAEAAGAPRRTIIAMTANAMQCDQERYLAAGMDDYLTKPLSVERVAQMLERWLPGRIRSLDRVVAAPSCPPDAPALDQWVLRGLERLEQDGSPGRVAGIVGLFVEKGAVHT